MLLDLRIGDVCATVADNSAHPEKAGHRAGYNGLASLSSSAQPRNIFVPDYAGMNLELYFDGVTADRPTLFEPRSAAMHLRKTGDNGVELHQPPTPHWQVESWTTFTLRELNSVDFHFTAVPRASTFQQGWMGIFWASYIHHPEDLGIWFPVALPEGDRLVRHYSRRHGEESTHRHEADRAEILVSHDQEMYMYGSYSRRRYAKPYFSGFCRGMRLLFLFEDNPNVRFAQSPSGGGPGCPAWDFQMVVPDYEVGKDYTLDARLVYGPCSTALDPEIEYARWNEFRANGLVCP